MSSRISTVALSTGRSVKADPVGSMKAFLFIVVAVVVVYLLYKVLKGIGAVTDVAGDFITTDAERTEIIGDKGYQNALLWLGAVKGIEEIVRSKKYGSKDQITNYLAAIKYPRAALGDVADQVADAKLPIVGFYVNGTEVMNAIGSLPTKATISLMAGVFNEVYGKGVTGYPLHTYLAKYLSTSEMDALAKIINSKPDL